MPIIEHEWANPAIGDTRCIRCGTVKAFHEAKPQNCVPQWGPEPQTRPTKTGQSTGDFAADDAEVIHARIVELEADRHAIRNTPAEPELNLNDKVPD